MALRNVGFCSAEIEEYPAAELKKAPSRIQRMPTDQTLIDYGLRASVGIAPEKRRCRPECRCIYAKSPMRSAKYRGTEKQMNLWVPGVSRANRKPIRHRRFLEIGPGHRQGNCMN